MASPRKRPQQARAKNTVARILAATAELINEGGLDSVTTNKIAERAHINIASLYQYFANKEAVINALIEDYQIWFARTINELMRDMENTPIEEAARHVVSAAMVLLRETQAIIPSIASHLVGSQSLPAAQQLENRHLEALRHYLTRQRDVLELGDIDTSIFVIYTAVTSVLAKHLAMPNSYLTDEEVIDEVVRLMLGYFPRKDAAPEP